MTDELLLPYKIGALLYAPAININIAEKIINGTYPNLTSIAFCLEDAIIDDALHEAEFSLVKTLKFIKERQNEKMPLLFVRVRNPQHLIHIHSILGENEDILTGYILPKFDLSNCSRYVDIIHKLNVKRKNKLYIMPILESKSIALRFTRLNVLSEIKILLDTAKEYVLNIRVGGNDFSNIYGLRRSINQTIYDIGVIRDILIDIINIFSPDYVVSGAVWEYFGNNPNDEWAKGLKNEIKFDKLNGFIGKTAIHPSQLPIIFENMKVDENDYNDALQILNWQSEKLGVNKSSDGNRMNELKCHKKWAERIKILGDIYGIRGDLNV